MEDNDKPRILIVDDRAENLLALSAILDSVEAHVHQAQSGNEALSLLLEYDFALVLLDVQMPEMDGYEVASIMQENPSTAQTPIIFLTAISKDEHYMQEGYLKGAVDYLAKPLNTDILLAKITVFLELWSKTHAFQQLNTKYKEAIAKLTEQKEALNEMAIKDHLTGLLQRRVFDELLIKEISKAVRHQTPLAIAMLDLDHFKAVNDNFGHLVGDEVLVSVANTFIELTRVSDVVCRFGGEEFVILMPNTKIEDAERICERIREAVENIRIDTEKGGLKNSISIGLVEYLIKVNSRPEKLLKHADDCLYKAKENGRNQVFSLSRPEVD